MNTKHIKTLLSSGLNNDRTIDLLVETTDDKCYLLKTSNIIKNQKQKEVTLTFKTKKLDKIKCNNNEQIKRNAFLKHIQAIA